MNIPSELYVILAVVIGEGIGFGIMMHFGMKREWQNGYDAGYLAGAQGERREIAESNTEPSKHYVPPLRPPGDRIKERLKPAASLPAAPLPRRPGAVRIGGADQ